MSIYTHRGSSQLDDLIEDHLRIITERVRPHTDAGILLGGYGRGEGTPFILPDGSQAPFNDYDLIVIVDTVDAAARIRFKNLEHELTEEIGLPVDLHPYALSRLPDCEFSLLNHEMKSGHMVLWGPDDVLEAMPHYDPRAIPLSEGSRLLLNRGKLLLDIKRRLASGKPLNEDERVRFIKFIHKVWLAFGDAALLEARKHDISYLVKRERVTEVCCCPERDQVVAGYLAAIELKEWGDYSALESFDVAAELAHVIAVYEKFLPWYRNQYTTRECSMPKAIALNLAWNKRLNTRHPREALYDAIIELLRDESALSHERFYALQRRFA